MTKIDRIHYNDVIIITMASQITSLTIVYSTVYSDADHRKHQSSAPLAFCAGNSPVTSEFPAQWAVTRIIFPFDDVIMSIRQQKANRGHISRAELSRLPWIFPGAPLIFNGAPGNIQSCLTGARARSALCVHQMWKSF